MRSTEAEAREKWCPFARVHEQGSAAAASNRIQDGAGKTTLVPVGSVCIGSTCMAWRWAGVEPADAKAGRQGRCGLVPE